MADRREEYITELNKSCNARRTVHTIGHSTRSIDEFTALLKAHSIELLVDVRRWPMSKRYPHFNREALSESLQAKGVAYNWRQELGGFRKPAVDSVNTAWRVATFRAYADFMLTGDFARIIQELEPIALKQRVALMCAEAVPWRCHRQLLADAFLVRKWPVFHIMDAGCTEHKLPAYARLEGTRIIYAALL
jgi:uncharacterized protein (DUF488 family)